MHRRLRLDHRLPRRPAAGHRRADRRQRHRSASRARHRHRALSTHHYGKASASPPRCRTACSISRASNCAISSGSPGPLTEYSQFGEGIPFGDAVPRAGNDFGGGQPGRILKCKGWETDPNAYIYFITQAPVWEKICDAIGEPGWKTHPDYAKPAARLPRLNEIFAPYRAMDHDQEQVRGDGDARRDDIPCGPILSMKELAEDPSLRATGTVVEVDHPEARQISVGRQSRSSCRTVPRWWCARPCSASIPTRSCGRFSASALIRSAEIHDSGALDPPRKVAAE